MDELLLIINGREVKGSKGDSVLDVCQKNGIDVPTLCHFPGLPEAGSCRMCIVEIEGMRGLDTACTIPAADKMVVRTETDLIKSLRKDTLQLLFAERNHFCPFCELSGDCELQALAYRYGIDHFEYPFLHPNLPVDASNHNFVLDHGRCVLCTRCVRVCDSKAGISTLAAMRRSTNTMIGADLNAPIGESSCVSCGACVQICPTGALFEKRSAYRGSKAECGFSKSVCPACGVGCAITAITRANGVLAVLGDDEGEVNEGLLCVKGRFHLNDPKTGRLTTPLIKKDGIFAEASWEEALDLIAAKFDTTKNSNAVLGMASSRSTNENLFSMQKFFKQVLGSDQLFALDAEVAVAQNKLAATVAEATMDDLLNADCFVVAGVDPRTIHGVVDSFIRRTAKKSGASVIVIDSADNGLADLAGAVLKPEIGMLGKAIEGMMAKGLADAAAIGVEPEELATAVKLLGQAKKPVIVYGKRAVVGAEAGTAALLAKLADAASAKVLALTDQANSRGAVAMGFAPVSAQSKGQVVFLMAGENDAEFAPAWMDGVEFVAVQAAYRTEMTARADVVLPAPTWSETAGSFTNTEGRVQQFGQAVDAPAKMLAPWEVFAKLAERMGSTEVLCYDGVESIFAAITSSVPGYDRQWAKNGASRETVPTA